MPVCNSSAQPSAAAVLPPHGQACIACDQAMNMRSLALPVVWLCLGYKLELQVLQLILVCIIATCSQAAAAL
jgi:hypothetical protein